MAEQAPSTELETPYAWLRLVTAILIGSIGGVSMWSVAVVLPEIQRDFGVDRATASLPYAVTMLGFAVGGLMMGRLTDKRGIVTPIVLGAVALGIGYAAASMARTMAEFMIAQAVLIGALGGSAMFAPLVADISLWFRDRRGLAVALVASGNYLAGVVWPPVLAWAIAAHGWRMAYLGTGLVCVATILPLTLWMRRQPPAHQAVAHPTGGVPVANRPCGLSPGVLQAFLMVAGVACCVAMSMPQVHLVAYCGDLGFGAVAGARMLTVMFVGGVVSRLASGWLSDRIGGLKALAVGSILQGLALAMFLAVSGEAGLTMVAGFFGLAQGGIVPSYAMIVREHYPAAEAGTRVSAVLMATIVGMALGGWLSGAIYDLTGTYAAAFLNGMAWNLLNVAIVVELIRRDGGSGRPVARELAA